MWNTSHFRLFVRCAALCSLLLQDAQSIAVCQIQNGGVRQDSTSPIGWAGHRDGVASPLNIPLILAGNFGELRADHFHTGLDFKTEGREGFPVLAATDGVISRVKISPYGYGRALYLSGPQGLTTVYAHLREFAPAIEQCAVDLQYKKRQFELDTRPSQSFVFETGDTIGWSGNSGGSGGPHLHFEIRETSTQKPLNPLLWQFEIADETDPELRGIWLLPVGNGSINGRQRPVKLEREGVVVAAGGFRVAIDALDRLDAARNSCGIYKAEMRVDEELVHAWELDTLDFSVNRDMNAHAYFPAWSSTGEQVHRMHRLPGNRLPIYTRQTTSDVLSCGGLVKCQKSLSIKIWDVHGNAVQKEWEVVWKSPASDSIAMASVNDSAQFNDRSLSHVVRSDDGSIEVLCPSRSFYQDFSLLVRDSGVSGFRIGMSDTPISKPVEVRADRLGCSAKTAVRSVGDDGAISGWYTGECRNGTFVFSTRQLGEYEWAVDSVPPRISAHRRHRTNEDFLQVAKNTEELRFTLSDDGTGISNFTATLDGKWILMRWDPKRERMWYSLSDGRHKTGEQQQLEITATDDAGNQVSWSGWVQF